MSLDSRIKAYENTAQHNERVYGEFTALTDSIAWLKNHRDTVEQHRWGFGDRAFHYMWYLLVTNVAERVPHVECLEIGVFKGQVISLWAKIGRELNLDLAITAISPLVGNLPTGSSKALRHKIRSIIDTKYRNTTAKLTTYTDGDYLAAVQEVFSEFGLEFEQINMIKGFSNEAPVIDQAQKRRYHIMYIDGDHSYEGVRSDINIYTPMLEDGGFLVMDDSAFFLPGKGYFKGYDSVARACEELLRLGFTNVLNIGHNRVYRKQ